MNLRFRQHYDKIQIIRDGVLIVEMPWQAALEASKAMHIQGKRAEEWAHAERIAADHALLIRTGAPFGFSSHPLIIDEAKKQAVSDRALRRYLPGGIRSTTVFGMPIIMQHPPKDKSDGKS